MKMWSREAVAVATSSPEIGSAFVRFVSLWFNRHLRHPYPWIGSRESVSSNPADPDIVPR